MRKIAGFLVGMALLCAVSGSQALARDIYVATNGSDSWAGTSAQPYRTIKGAISRASYGDVIRVRAGTYTEGWIQVKSGLTLISEDGLYAAKINANGSSALRFENGCTNAEVDGFEVYSIRNGGSGWYDGLLRAYNCSDIRIRNLKLRDAPRDADVVKIGGASYTTTGILLENCVIYNPAPRNADLTGGSGWQENVDIYPADGVTVRGCWIYHKPPVYSGSDVVDGGGDTLIYAKGHSKNILWENNVFGPVHNVSYNNASTSAGGPSPSFWPSCENFVARNNLFLSCAGDGAFALLSAKNVEFYNNIIWNYRGNRAAIEFWRVNVGHRNENLKVYNNIIWNTNGRPVYEDRGKWTSDGTYIPILFEHDYNLYYNVAGGGDVNINAEANSIFAHPMLAAPAEPVHGVDTWATIVARFKPQAGSPAIDAGFDLGSLVADDINGVVRPVGAAFDIGAYEHTAAGDLNKDGLVNAIDLLMLANSWNKSLGEPGYDPAADINGDNTVNVIDLLALAHDWPY